ncbi:MAG TPA: hypothetical protein VE570_08395 [Thermoleophilaceae bacterium]|nr:hypothetical protein [Thermoleophilaceae bacterium]
METWEERRNDPAWQAVDEAGGGEQEGFEQAEELLIENAENAEHTTALDGFPDEREDEPGRASYGDADEVVKGSEVVSEEGVPPDGDTDS